MVSFLYNCKEEFFFNFKFIIRLLRMMSVFIFFCYYCYPVPCERVKLKIHYFRSWKSSVASSTSRTTSCWWTPTCHPAPASRPSRTRSTPGSRTSSRWGVRCNACMLIWVGGWGAVCGARFKVVRLQGVPYFLAHLLQISYYRGWGKHYGTTCRLWV